jgi:hypothetical protein
MPTGPATGTATIIRMTEEGSFGVKDFAAVRARLGPRLLPPDERCEHLRQKLACLELVDGVEVSSVDVFVRLITSVEMFDGVEDVAGGEHEIFVGRLAGSDVLGTDRGVSQAVGRGKVEHELKVKAIKATCIMGVMSARTVAMVENWNFILDRVGEYAKEGLKFL